jgi:hypothetical protein
MKQIFAVVAVCLLWSLVIMAQPGEYRHGDVHAIVMKYRSFGVPGLPTAQREVSGVQVLITSRNAAVGILEVTLKFRRADGTVGQASGMCKLRRNPAMPYEWLFFDIGDVEVIGGPTVVEYSGITVSELTN